MSLIEENGTRKVRMAHLAVVGTHSTNGVAEIHSELLRTRVVRDFAEMFPERFNNKTNGVTPRRWLLLANPWLSALITEAIGDGWVTTSSSSASSKPLAEDRRLPRHSSARPSAKPRCRFVDWLKAPRRSGRSDTSSTARSNEFTNTSANCSTSLHIVVLYNRLRRNPNLDFAAAHVLLRRQGGAGLPSGQADHQADQQRRRHDRRRPGDARAAQGAVPAGLQRHHWPNG